MRVERVLTEVPKNMPLAKPPVRIDPPKTAKEIIRDQEKFKGGKIDVTA